MNARVDDIGRSMPPSPEQRALIASWGDDVELAQAINVLRIEIDSLATPAQIAPVLSRLLQTHAIFGARFHRQPGLRIQCTDSAAVPIALTEIDDLSAFVQQPFAIERGELLRAGFVRGPGSTWTLVLAVHALAADRGSLVRLFEDIAAGCAEQWPIDVFQYEQYIEWRAELEDDVDVGGAYWRDYLQEHTQDPTAWSPPRLVHRRGGLHSADGERRHVSQHIDRVTLARLQDVAARLDVAPELLLHGLWCAQLAYLTGFNVYATGWQHDCRRDYDVMQGAIGVFEKVLPLLVDCRRDEPFAAWIKRLAERVASHLDAQEYCRLDALPAQQLGVGFACGNAPASVEGARISSLPGPLPVFELVLLVEISATHAELQLFADSALYSARAIETLLVQYLALLDGALARPDSTIAALPWPASTHGAALRGPDLDTSGQSIAQRVADWARITPDAPAIVDNGIRLDYAELHQRTLRLANWLHAQGVEPGALVALELPRSADLVVAMLASWWVGAGYVPLEPEWPLERRRSVLDDAQPALLLCTTGGGCTGPWQQATLADIDLAAHGTDLPARSAQPGDPAYVLYTSGSTGRPKGVFIEQRQLLNYVAAATTAMQLERCRRWGLVSSVAADLGNTALFGALFNGACLVIAAESDTLDAAAFARFIAVNAIDALKIVPSHLDALLETDAAQLPRTLVLGGEAPMCALIERIAQVTPDCVVYNHYGPTETTVGVLVHRVERDDLAADVLPLSHALANCEIHVLDESRRPVPVGAQGEVHIGGAQLCRGYLNRDAGAAFCTDPCDSSRRLYRTGDLAWVLPDGGIRLAGRADHQVKIRGYRIEPAEVEAALLALPGVRQATVTVRVALEGNELLAFIAGDAIDVAAMRARLAQVLPSHMLPANYITLADFPRLPNGKIDRRALAALDIPVALDASGAQPRNALEAVLAEAMAVLLKRDAVPADADFFELGGHSLLVIRLVARIRKILKLEIEPGLVFDHPTAQALAAALGGFGDPAQLERLAQVHLASA